VEKIAVFPTADAVVGWTFGTAPLWSVSTDPPVRAHTLFLPSAQTLFCSTKNGLLHALNPQTGKVFWKKTVPGMISGAPAAIATHLLLGTADNILYALNPADGQTLWTYEAKTSILENALPDQVNNQVYFAAHDSIFHCLNLKTGKQKWHLFTFGIITSPPALLNNKIYIGTAEGYVYCLDATKSAKILWRKKLPMPVSGPLSLSAHGLFVPVSDPSVNKGALCALSLSGELKWTFDLGSATSSGPVPVGNRVVIGAEDGSLYCIE
jgi:outer membrane protein assembly factor BamB